MDKFVKNFNILRAAVAFAGLLVLVNEIALMVFKSNYHPAWWLTLTYYLGFGLPLAILTGYKLFSLPSEGERRRDTLLVAVIAWLVWPVVAVGVLHRSWKTLKQPKT